MKTLVVYFSRTGHTRQIAHELAARLHADSEEIREVAQDSSGIFGYLRAGWQSLTQALPPLAPSKKQPEDYELTLIGTPVWNYGVSAPARAYAKQHSGNFRRVAFFCTEGGSGDTRAFDQLAKACGAHPVATLAVTEKELAAPAHQAALDKFVRKLAPH
jgi:flavodoxin